MSAGAEGLDGQLGTLIPMCKEAVDAVPLALLDHRGKLLEAESTFPYRLVQYFGLRGAKVFGAAADFVLSFLLVNNYFIFSFPDIVLADDSIVYN